MRILSLLIFGCMSSSVFAAEPANLEPLAPPPAMSTETDSEPVDEAGINIIKQSALNIEEFRSGGRIYMIKVTPKVGPPYYLIDQRGDGKFARQEGLDSGFRPPQWVIHTF